MCAFRQHRSQYLSGDLSVKGPSKESRAEVSRLASAQQIRFCSQRTRTQRDQRQCLFGLVASSRLNRLSGDANRRRPAGVAYLASDLLENVELISAEQLAQAGLLTGLEYLPRLGETLFSGRGHVQERGASVARVGVAFDQPLVFHTVCEATEAACR